MRLTNDFMKGFNERAAARSAEHAAEVASSFDRQHDAWAEHQTQIREEKQQRGLKAAEEFGARRKELRARAERAQAALNDARSNLDQAITDDDLDAARRSAVDVYVWDRATEKAAQELITHEAGRPWMG